MQRDLGIARNVLADRLKQLVAQRDARARALPHRPRLVRVPPHRARAGPLSGDTSASCAGQSATSTSTRTSLGLSSCIARAASPPSPTWRARTATSRWARATSRRGCGRGLITASAAACVLADRAVRAGHEPRGLVLADSRDEPDLRGHRGGRCAPSQVGIAMALGGEVGARSSAAAISVIRPPVPAIPGPLEHAPHVDRGNFLVRRLRRGVPAGAEDAGDDVHDAHSGRPLARTASSAPGGSPLSSRHSRVRWGWSA
jgi:hypothetical protein